jgi:hypothetical protein
VIGSYSTAARRPKLPPPTDPNDPEALTDTAVAGQCRIYLNWIFRYRVSKRAELERMWNRARLYDAAKQWLQPYRKAGAERLWYTWEPIKVTGRGDLFPRPVRNVFSPAIQDEVARLVGVGSKPYVRLDDKDKEEGARLAKQVLLDRNEKTEWNTKDQRVGSYHCSLYGQWIEESRFEFSKTSTFAGPPSNAVICKPCGFILKDPALPPSATSGSPFPVPSAITMKPDLTSLEEVPPQIPVASACPQCGQPMEPFEDIPREMWQNGTDSIGRPMAVKRPLGEDVTAPRSCYDFFPDNQGVGYQTAADMEAFGFRTPRSVNYVKARYDNTCELDKEHFRDVEAFAHHPVMMTWGMGHLAAFTDGIWDGWGMLDEYYAKPSDDYPEGRSIVMWGNRLLYNGTYFHPQTDIELLHVEVGQWELRDNEIWGKPLAEDMFSTQDNINSRRAQSMNLHQKFTDPKIIIHEGMDLRFSGAENDTYASDIWKMNVRGIPPEIAQQYPKFWGNQGTPGSVWQEEAADTEHIATATGARAAEVGNVSGVELNYSALLFAATKSAERRKPRIEGLRKLKRGTWTHRLRCIAHFYREDRLVTVREDSGEEAVKQFRGFQLLDQTDVALEDEPLVDSAIALRASIEQGLKYGTIRTSANGGSYEADRKINEAIGVPRDLSTDRNSQWELAHFEWSDWLDDEIEPAIDQDGDDHQLHLRRHQDDLEARDAVQMTKELEKQGILWGRDILLPTWEWPRLLQQLQQTRAAYDQAAKVMQDPDKMMDTMLGAGVPPEEVMQQMQQAQQKLTEAKQALAAFPPQLELQIYNCWKRLLVTGTNPRVLDDTGNLIWPVHVLVRFKTHTLAHKWLLGNPAAPVTQPGGPQPGPAGPSPPPAPMAALQAGVAPGASTGG